VGGRAQLFELLAGEDINGDQVDLGVTVLSGLGSRHVNNLAGTSLDHNVTTLAEGRALHGESGRRAGIGTVEGVLMLSNDKMLARSLEQVQTLRAHAIQGSSVILLRLWGCQLG